MGKGEDDEDVEGSQKMMPFDAAHALARLGLHEAWRASFVRVEGMNEKKPGFVAGLEKGADWHKARAKDARDAWKQLSRKWADGPRGQKEGTEVSNALLDAAKAAADHCAAMRIPNEGGEKKAEEAFARFQAARGALKTCNGVVSSALRERMLAVLWNAGWHAANVLGEKVEEALEEEPEEEEPDEGEDEDEDEEDEDEDEDEEEDEEARFGEEYPGSSDDAIEDMASLLEALGECFWEQPKLHGVRLPLDGALEALEPISSVPGPFGGKGLDAVRLALPDLAGAADPLGDSAKAVLQKAEALELRVVLELPAAPGKKHEKWLQALAAAASSLKCLRGVALPAVAEPAEAWGLIQALRSGGLAQDRCACFLRLPGGQAEDAEGDWTPAYSGLVGSELKTGAPGILFADGNTLLEAPAAFAGPDQGGPATPQELLDAASHLSQDLCQHIGLVSSWSLEVPPAVRTKPGSKPDKAKSVALGAEWYAEFAQRLRGSVEETSHGWFFEAWTAQADDENGERGLEACLAEGKVDLGLEVQTMQPTGPSHQASLVYLHGFMCDGYSYLLEPEHFYRAKPKKKAKAKKGSKAAAEADDEQEFEPIPGLKVLLPTAPVRKITCHNGDEQHAWYDYLTDYDGDQEDDFPEEELEEQIRRIHALLDAEAALVGSKNVFLGGASQGCGVAMHAALSYEGELGGVVGTMGQLLTRTPVAPEWVAKRVPVFVYNGLADTIMPWDKWVSPTWKRLQDAGADVRIVTTEGVDHGEHEDVWTRAFLAEALRPSSVKAVAKKKPSGKK